MNGKRRAALHLAAAACNLVGTVTRVWRAGAILAVILAAYSNSFRGPFVIDDQASVVQNPDIRELTRLIACCRRAAIHRWRAARSSICRSRSTMP